MLKQIEGSQGVAQAVALCRPEVICAYPISPQTHIVEALGTMTRKGLIPNCEYINVESEFAAMSAPAPTPRRPLRACSTWSKLSTTLPVWACPS